MAGGERMIKIPNESLQDISDYIYQPCGKLESQEKPVCPACMIEGLERAYRMGYLDAEKEFKENHRAFPQKNH
jgi:hypothetical protein